MFRIGLEGPMKSSDYDFFEAFQGIYMGSAQARG